MADNNNKLTLLKRNKNIALAIANFITIKAEEDGERKQDNNEQQHLKYVHKFSGMGTGKEKKNLK